MNYIKELLILSFIPYIGPQKIRNLVNYFKTPTSVLEASARELIKVPGIDKKSALCIVNYRRNMGEKFADEQLKKVSKIGARIITYWDKQYPNLLKKIYDPPVILYVLGEFSEQDSYSIAIVGTRRPTSYGHTVTENLVKELSRYNMTIVSGLARGIDTVAHNSALENKTRTIAVLGSGLDIPYPPENRRLLARIAENGAVISEFPMGTKPDAPNFPRRNRIISGLALGTVVIESTDDGGALITASFALDQNREVFAVPGNITEKHSNGPNKLIRDGRAKLIISAKDIINELSSQINLPLETSQEGIRVELTPIEESIYSLLSNKPMHIDTISELSGLPVSDALANLLTLEFKGLARQLAGKLFLRS